MPGPGCRPPDLFFSRERLRSSTRPKWRVTGHWHAAKEPALASERPAAGTATGPIPQSPLAVPVAPLAAQLERAQPRAPRQLWAGGALIKGTCIQADRSHGRLYPRLGNAPMALSRIRWEHNDLIHERLGENVSYSKPRRPRASCPCQACCTSRAHGQCEHAQHHKDTSQSAIAEWECTLSASASAVGLRCLAEPAGGSRMQQTVRAYSGGTYLCTTAVALAVGPSS